MSTGLEEVATSPPLPTLHRKGTVCPTRLGLEKGMPLVRGNHEKRPQVRHFLDTIKFYMPLYLDLS